MSDYPQLFLRSTIRFDPHGKWILCVERGFDPIGVASVFKTAALNHSATHPSRQAIAASLNPVNRLNPSLSQPMAAF
ncbi:hypothetical protein [Ferrovibrio sp.]|uniref:hypothetical protein n=1 Tax=Ferrovibrio sp. TaxID=1917215 RepID=UPI003D10A004